jgi:hypothetical protein
MQFFIFCDKFWGTLRVPKDKEVVADYADREEEDKAKKE